jgi:hypothetical protein
LGVESYEVDFWETGQHSAQRVIDSLGSRAQAKVYAVLAEMQTTPRGLLRNLKKTKQDQLWEYKARVPEGGLRVLFAYGKGGKIWCLGAFVKRNDKEGNKLLKHPYEKLAIAASQT